MGVEGLVIASPNMILRQALINNIKSAGGIFSTVNDGEGIGEWTGETSRPLAHDHRQTDRVAVIYADPGNSQSSTRGDANFDDVIL